ncbi:uncharacterized protein LOC110418400 isoform X2 [Herrania umbratica]|uniref:Uncharacterized protein LOC110418400 isoform X2 n=1 Tax=Herrania umbratica TaxID=108875 RepID=A0A6J1AIX4_9ROSI|nr:uncharacterized protein LOC110418400 isoform X2 [Herrania umbratica]
MWLLSSRSWIRRMSRCLPFPPPRYVRNGVSGEALLELIKVQRERVKAEREKEEEKWRSKKETRKEREQGEICQKKPGHHERRQRFRGDEGGGRSENQGKTENGTQEMESSGLTEELKQPTSDSFYESSDNSQSIHKKRNADPAMTAIIMEILFRLMSSSKSTRLLKPYPANQTALP